MGNQFPFRDQTCRNEQCFAGKFFALCCYTAGDVGISLNLPDGIAAEKPNGMFLQTALVSCHAAALILFLNHGNCKTNFRQLPRHDESQIAAAEDHHRAFRDNPMKVHHLLHLSGGIDAFGTGSGNSQGSCRDLPAAGSQNQLRKANLFPAEFRSGQQRRLFLRYRQHSSVQRQMYRLGKIAYQIRGILHAAFIFTEALMAALQKDTAQRGSSVCQQHSGSAARLCRSDSCRATADNEDIIVFHHGIPPAAVQWHSSSGFPGSVPYRSLPDA